MGDRADGTGDLNGSDVSDCGLSPLDMKDMKTSWISNMNTVKAAILDNNGFIWQQMVNNGTGTHPIVSQGKGCAPTLRAACKRGSIQQRGALNYGIVRGNGGGGHGGHTDAKQLTAEKCQTQPPASSQKWSQPHGNGGPLVHTATGRCVTVSGALNDLDLMPCLPGQPTQNFTFGDDQFDLRVYIANVLRLNRARTPPYLVTNTALLRTAEVHS